MMLNRYLIITDYTFKEVLQHEIPSIAAPFSTNINFYTYLHANFAAAPIFKDSALKDNINDLLNLLYSRYFKQITISKSGDLTSEDCKSFIIKVINVIIYTYDKYNILLKLYNDNKDKLLAQIKSVTTGHASFNDTPQNPESADEFAEDNHRTNITQTKGETATDGDTLIARLKEIENKIAKVYKSWLDEFEVLFIEEGNA